MAFDGLVLGTLDPVESQFGPSHMLSQSNTSGTMVTAGQSGCPFLNGNYFKTNQ